MLSQVCLSTADVDVVCVAPKKKARDSPGLYLDGRGDGCFLSLVQGDETTIGYFTRMKLKKLKKLKKKMPRAKAIEEIAGLMKGLRSARQQSPFFTMVIRDEWLVSFDYAIVIHSIHSMLKNSIHSIQKLMNGPTGFVPRQIQIWKCAKSSESVRSAVKRQQQVLNTVCKMYCVCKMQ